METCRALRKSHGPREALETSGRVLRRVGDPRRTEVPPLSGVRAGRVLKKPLGMLNGRSDKTQRPVLPAFSSSRGINSSSLPSASVE